jgi:hypothetical protein
MRTGLVSRKRRYGGQSMSQSRKWAWALVLAFSCAGAAAQVYDDESDGRRENRWKERPTFLFTPNLVDLMINRMTDETAKHYGMDEDQLWATREVIKDRVMPWLFENQDQIITLTNRYFEVVLGDDPPTSEEVQTWATEFEPLAEDFYRVVQDTTGEMRTFMTEDQRLILDGELAAIDVGVDYMRQRVEVWKRGGYDWETEWPRAKGFQRKERERVESLTKAQEDVRDEVLGGRTAQEVLAGIEPKLAEESEGEESKAKTAGASPQQRLDEWETYVVNFVKRYELTEGQQTQASKYLESAKRQRENYLGRKAGDIAKLERLANAADSEEEKAELRERVERIYATLDRMFGQLKERLERIPTGKQRREAALRNLTADARATASGSGEGTTTTSESSGE